jgi:hypothetical protein
MQDYATFLFAVSRFREAGYGMCPFLIDEVYILSLLASQPTNFSARQIWPFKVIKALAYGKNASLSPHRPKYQPKLWVHSVVRLPIVFTTTRTTGALLLCI